MISNKSSLLHNVDWQITKGLGGGGGGVCDNAKTTQRQRKTSATFIVDEEVTEQMLAQSLIATCFI